MLASWATIAPLPVIAAVAGLRRSPLRGWVILLTHVVYVALVTRIADYTESALVVFVGFAVLVSLVVAVLWFMPRSLSDDRTAS